MPDNDESLSEVVIRINGIIESYNEDCENSLNSGAVIYENSCILIAINHKKNELVTALIESGKFNCVISGGRELAPIVYAAKVVNLEAFRQMLNAQPGLLLAPFNGGQSLFHIMSQYEGCEKCLEVCLDIIIKRKVQASAPAPESVDQSDDWDMITTAEDSVDPEDMSTPLVQTVQPVEKIINIDSENNWLSKEKFLKMISTGIKSARMEIQHLY